MDAEKNIRAFLAIEPPEDIGSHCPPAGKIKKGNQRRDQLDASAGQSPDFEIFRQY